LDDEEYEEMDRLLLISHFPILVSHLLFVPLQTKLIDYG